MEYNKFKIALDAGHGLNTAGKRCMKSLDPNETREWWLNNRICDKIEKLLKQYSNYELLRIDDTTGKKDVPLDTRTNKANKWGADLYLSVHHDSDIKGGSGGGTTVFIHVVPSALSREYQKIVYEEFIKQTGKFGNRSEPMATKDLHVLRETDMPAVLIECGFMDSSVDVPLILSEEFANKAALGLTNAIVKIGELKKIESEEIDMEELKKLTEEVKFLRKSLDKLGDRLTKLEKPMIYNYVDENMPEWARATIQKLVDKGMLQGDKNGLGLTEELLRIFVINDRAGLYD